MFGANMLFSRTSESQGGDVRLLPGINLKRPVAVHVLFLYFPDALKS